MNKTFGIALSAGLWLAAGAGNVKAATYDFANLTAFSLSSTSAGSATGTLMTTSGVVNINYSGDLTTATQVNNMGTNYFTGFNSVYTNSTVSNLPTRADIITLAESYTATPNMLTFSTAVVNPILDIVSLGSPGAQVTYNFNATPIILSQGAAYWGGCSTCLSVSGNSLIGTEGSGVVEFLGTYSSLSWTTAGGEYWNGFTVGVAGASTATPEPATVGLVGFTGALLVAGYRRLRARRTA